MNGLGVSSSAIAGIFAIAIILVLLFGAKSGFFNSFVQPAAANASLFSISANVSSASLYSGKSAPVYVAFLNPFNESINAYIGVSTALPVKVSPLSRAVFMPAQMSVPSDITFNSSCAGSSGTVSILFSMFVHDFWQNITTSVVSFPYNINASLIPQTVYRNGQQGFMQLSAKPQKVETGLPPGPFTATIMFSMSPAYKSADFYVYGNTLFPVSSPNGNINDLVMSISNNTGGIASAYAYYDGQKHPFSVSGDSLSLELYNVSLSLFPYGLPIKITVVNSSSTSQNIINIDTNYDYYLGFQGNNLVTCV